MLASPVWNWENTATVLTFFFFFFPLKKMMKRLCLLCLDNSYWLFYLLCNTVWIRWYLPFLKNRIIQDICHSWLRFEREFGKLEDFDHALQKVHSFLFCFSFVVVKHLCIISQCIRNIFVTDIKPTSAKQLELLGVIATEKHNIILNWKIGTQLLTTEVIPLENWNHHPENVQKPGTGERENRDKEKEKNRNDH